MACSITSCLALFFVTVLIYLYKTNHVVNYYAKYVYFAVVYTVLSLVMIPIAAVRPTDCSSIRIAAVLLNFVHKFYGFKIEKRNTKAFETCTEPAIFIVNHQSILDMIGTYAISPYRTTYLSKKEILYTGPFGLAAWLCGLVFIDRLNPEKARKTMINTAQSIKDKGIRLWIFPEGTRGMNETVQPFRKGAFHLAVQAQIPVYPVVFSSYRHFFDPKRKILGSGRVIINCLPAVRTEGLTSEDVTELTEKVYKQMNEEYQKISKEVQDEAKYLGTSLLE